MVLTPEEIAAQAALAASAAAPVDDKGTATPEAEAALKAGTEAALAAAGENQDDDIEADPADRADPKAWQEKADKRVKELRAVRANRDALTTEMASLKAQIAELGPKAELSAQAETKLSELNAQLADARMETQFERLSRELKVADTEITLEILRSRKLVTFDDKGNPTNLREATEALLTAHPNLAAPVPLVENGTVQNAGRKPTLAKESIKGLSLDEFMANRDAALAAMRS